MAGAKKIQEGRSNAGRQNGRRKKSVGNFSKNKNGFHVYSALGKARIESPSNNMFIIIHISFIHFFFNPRFFFQENHFIKK